MTVHASESPRGFDLFISYRRKDAGPVLQLAELLVASGVRVWVDQHRISDFESITDEIRTGIAQSKALLAWYSVDYPKSRPCQQELTAAFIAAQRDGDPRRRVLVVNPETSASHVLPIQLADQQHAPTTELALLASRVADRIAKIDGPLGANASALPRQYGHTLTGSNRFFGRLKDLWAIHSSLFARESAIVSGTESPGIAQLTGLGGIGKSLLAEEYALRFSPAFPTGIFWLRAGAYNPTLKFAGAGEVEARRHDQFRSVAIGLGIDVTGLDFDRIEARIASALRDAGGTFLWVIDDLGSDLLADALRRWVAPSPNGRTLITTRSREYAGIGTQIPLEVLDPDEALALLTVRRSVPDIDERSAAAGLCADLGFHPLALDVTGSALVSWPSTIKQFRRMLAEPSRDELDLAAELADALPNGHEKGIAATLLRSIRRLGPEGQDFLRLAARIASHPIPTSLVENTFRELTGNVTEARNRTAYALAQTAKASLVEGTAEAPRRVHVLLARTMRLYDVEGQRQLAIHEAAVRALTRMLPSVADVRTHEALALEVSHARALVSDVEGRAERAELLGWVARYDLERGEDAAAEAASRIQLSTYEALFGKRDARTLLAAGDLARALKAAGKSREAVEIDKRVLKDRIRLLGRDHIDTLTAMNNLATTLGDLGEHESACRLQERVLQARVRLLGPEHEHTLFALNNLAGTLAQLGRTRDALPIIRQAYEGRRKVLGSDHVSTLISRTSFAMALWEIGESQAAEAHLRETVATLERLQGPLNPRTIRTKATLGRILISRENPQDAVELLAPLVDAARATLGDSHETTHLVMNNYAKALAMLGRHSEARPLLESAVEGQRRRSISRDWLLVRYALNLAETYVALGEVSRARVVLAVDLSWLLAEPSHSREGDKQLDYARVRKLASLLAEANHPTH